MTMTLGNALITDDSKLDLDNALITKGYDDARKELGKEHDQSIRGPLGAKSINSGLKDALLKSLNIALDDILVRAWSGWDELSQYANPKLTPKADINVVTVSDHTISATHKPSVDVFVHGVRVDSFDFEVAADLNVKGINLKVQGGEITRIELGTLTLGGRIELKDHEILNKNVAEVKMPLAMDLATPIPILWRDTDT